MFSRPGRLMSMLHFVPTCLQLKRQLLLLSRVSAFAALLGHINLLQEGFQLLLPQLCSLLLHLKSHNLSPFVHHLLKQLLATCRKTGPPHFSPKLRRCLRMGRQLKVADASHMRQLSPGLLSMCLRAWLVGAAHQVSMQVCTQATTYLARSR